MWLALSIHLLVLDELFAISQYYGIPILEDAAESLGSLYKGQVCGSLGEIGIFSFNGNKIITTSGGGALVSSQKEHKDKAVFLATQARDAAPHYQHSEIGYNYRLSNICAGIGRGQMEVLDKHIGFRRNVHQKYVDFFNEIESVTVLNEPNEDYFSNHWLTAIITDSFEKREALRLAFESQNIETRPLWKPMHLQPVFSKSPYYGNTIAEELFTRGLCLPSGSNLTNQDWQRIHNVLKDFFTV